MSAPTLEGPKRATTPAGNPITASDRATSSSAHARINIPLNLANWKHLDESIQAELLWYHQHLLDEGISWDEAEKTLSKANGQNYDQNTIYKVLRGEYEGGSYKNVVDSILSYRKTVEIRGTIQQAEFSVNSSTRLIFKNLDYALANNSIAIIIGESGQGKTLSGEAWQHQNNHGRSVMVRAPVYGGTKGMLRRIASGVGVNKNLPVSQMLDSIFRAFNKNRILIVDEAHCLLTGDRRQNPVTLELLREIHDETKCGLALLATARFDGELRRMEYMFEQLLGRALTVRLPKKIKESELEALVRQYVPRPGAGVMEPLMELANKPASGRLRVVVQVLKVASRMANKRKVRCGEEHVLLSIKTRKILQGDEEMPEEAE